MGEERRRKREVEMALSSIHPNPGPTEGRKQGRRERRKRRRQRRREERARRVVEEARRGDAVVREELVVVTWNVQGMSLRDASRRKLRMVAGFAEWQ